jgi:hypothetical protein
VIYFFFVAFVLVLSLAVLVQYDLTREGEPG